MDALIFFVGFSIGMMFGIGNIIEICREFRVPSRKAPDSVFVYEQFNSGIIRKVIKIYIN
ncbi:hypothetical protein [Lunatimonas salinarum]|uniref:hypothetical protein n=1 Tax=Lunatimonas salinarum TaxID=1774590 RepID=UPI001ADF09C6|nr:hypothetical protein [Lunatimonas salinarum]